MKNRDSRKLTKIILLLIFILTIEFTATMKVDAYTPVTYTCCINYTYSEGDLLDGFENNSIGGVQIDNFENLSNWTIGGTGASYQADLINFKEGNQGLKLIATNGNRAYADKAINNNFSNTNNFAIWLYIENASSFRAPVMYITSTGTAWSKYFSQQMFGSFKTGWNKLIFDKSSFSNTNGESWNNVMNRIRITIYPNIGQNTNGTFDDLRYDVNNDWIGPTQEADIINFKEGQQGLKLIGINGTTAYTDKTISSNFSNTNNFAIWLYIENASNTDYVTIYLTSSGSTWNKYFYDLSYRYVKTGWNRFVLNKHSFVNNGGESWNNVMNRIRVRMYPITGENANITLDDLRYNITGQRAKLMIEFDDGETNVLTKAYPVLSANNQTGVSYVIPEYVLGNDRWYMTLDNLRTLQNGGWDISSHTMNHTNLAEANDSYQTYALNSSYDWLVDNKFQKSAGFIAYPYGTFNDQTIEKVKKRYILGRATKPESYQQHFTLTDDAIMYIQRTVNVYNDTPVQTVKDQINDTINAKLLGKVVFHTIADSNPVNDRYTYLTSDFKKISDYIKSQSADIDVITNSEYVIPNIKNFTPVINKTTRIYSNGSSALITKNKYDEYMPNMTVKPSSGSIDINITTYNESGGTIGFSESSPESNLQISYSIGDRIPNKTYDVRIYWTNGTKYQDFNISANNTGYINYNSVYAGSRYQEIVINNLPLSIISSLPVTDPTTIVDTSQSFEVYLNKIANITWYINGSMVQTNSNADSANYTNSTADIGIYNISATANVGLDSVSRTWNWTVNPRPNASFRFIVWADTKQGTSILTNESIIANGLNPAFTIYPGDLMDCEIYENPTCFSNGFSTWKTALNGGGTNSLFSKTFATRGNHDANTDTPWQSNFDFADTATRIGATNYSAQTLDTTYSFDYANWHFVGLDATGDDISDMPPSEITWLDNDLTAAESRGMTRAFLFWHWPIYYLTEPSFTPPAALITVLNKHPIISAGFFGHEHLVAYTHIDSSRIPTITHPFEEFVSGAAGAELHTATAGKYDYWLNDGGGSSKSGFMAVDVSGNNFIVSVYNVDGSIDKTLSFTTAYIPPAPVSLASTQGNFWVNHTWQPGTGNKTDSYNISVNGSWTNGTDITYSNNSVEPHGWSNISVYAYNNSGIGTLNLTSASQNIQVANNIPIQVQIGNKAVSTGNWLNFTVSATDADSDPLTYGSNNSKGILNTSTGNYSWQPGINDAGQYVWYFNASDNFGGTDTETITVTVNNVGLNIISYSPLTDPTGLPGDVQNFSISLNKTANITWYMNGIEIQTNPNAEFANYTNSTANTGIYNITVIAEDGYNSVLKRWNWTVNSQYIYAPGIILWSNNKTNDNNLMLIINTSEIVNFNATANQTILTWNWYKDNVNLSNNYDKLNVSWNTPGTKNLNVNATNSNGTSNTVSWTVTVVTAINQTLVSSCGNLNQAGTLYVLTNSLSSSGTCFTIGANNIILEGQGYDVNYSTTSSGYGIVDTGGYGNITIQNLNLKQKSTNTYSHGIYFRNVVNSRVENISISTNGSSSDGIYLSSSSGNNFSDVNLATSGTSAYGIYSISSNSNYFSGLNISTTGYNGNGMYVTSSSRNSYSNTTISTSGTYAHGIYTNSNYNNFSNNNITVSGGTGTIGFYLNSASYNIVNGGSVISNLGNDYYLQNAGATNSYANTNFTTRKIYLNDNNSSFNYNKETNGGVWLNTIQATSPSASLRITRTLINWTQTNVSWQETLTSSRRLNYNINGLLANTNYKVWNGTVIAYSLITDNNGNLPVFDINFTTSVKVIKVIP